MFCQIEYRRLEVRAHYSFWVNDHGGLTFNEIFHWFSDDEYHFSCLISCDGALIVFLAPLLQYYKEKVFQTFLT